MGQVSVRLGMSISTHAPRAGSDCSHFKIGSFVVCISIHAPRAGSDNA